ncbi:MAG: glycoside hydrolase [Peptococcaceae bacterium]
MNAESHKKLNPSPLDTYGDEQRIGAVKRKNRKKKIRVLIQVVLLFLVVTAFINLFATGHKYIPVADKPETSNKFIAISYFGVEKFANKSRTLISQERLKEHLSALSAMGYTTISQQQIADHYQKGTPLPEKSLFLMFEDGRRDTAVFAHPLLEENNFMASVMTYADKFAKKDNKFLSPADIKKLLGTTYWEPGTNGYRLEYINVYDRYRNFFGRLNSDEFVMVSPYLRRDYNHYLMDFIRDEDRLTVESYEEMSQRITADYESMKYIYETKLGFLPSLYVLMHANTGAFGTDPYVSAVNKEEIEAKFAMNFNREGLCLNTPDSSVYDLTRMQPQANWYSNHLIMRIADDTGETPLFVTGDDTEAKRWDTVFGAAEFRGDTIVLTSEPDGFARMRLLRPLDSDFDLDVVLKGNVAGKQTIGFGADRELQTAVTVSLENNRLYVRNIRAGVAVELYSLDLFEFDGGSVQSVEENEKESMLTYGNSILKHDYDYQKLQEAHRILEKWSNVKAATTDKGAEGYVPDIDLLDLGERNLSIRVKNGALTIEMDGKAVIKNLQVESQEGYLYLESSALTQEQYNQRNLIDDVYDGVFENLTISSPDEQDIYYAYTLSFFEKAGKTITNVLQKVASFFINSF